MEILDELAKFTAIVIAMVLVTVAIVCGIGGYVIGRRSEGKQDTPTQKTTLQLSEGRIIP